MRRHPDTGTPTTDTGDTAPPVATVSASCAQTAQPQVFECTVTLSTGPATLEFSSAGHPTRTFTSATPAVSLQIYGWGLLANTVCDWDAGSGVVGQWLVSDGFPGAPGIAGGALVTCADQGHVYAFRDGSSVADWELRTSCGGAGGFSGNSTRAYPVTIE